MILTEKQPTYWEETPPDCYFVHRRSHIPWPGVEPVPPRREAGWHLTACTTTQENDNHDRNIQGETQ